ncbi:MAG TPA: type VI secretion system-associated protein TagF [Acetobacteraceae bacterium]
MTIAVASGFYGKLPARGDFLRAGLPRSFTDPWWDEWLQAAMADSRDALGKAWLNCWMEAPVWRFCLPDGACGPHGVLGLWIPSVDRAGRYFPQAFAMVLPGAGPDALAVAGTAWLDEAERIGLDALEQEIQPDSLSDRLAALPAPEAVSGDGDAPWWTAGSPYVAATALRLPGLPDPAQFATMLRTPLAPDGSPAEEAAAEGRPTKGGFLEAT